MKKSKFTVCDRMTQVCDKNLLLQRGIDPMPLAFKASPILLAFEASGIESVPLTFKASVMSTAPVVLHYTREGRQM